MGTSDTELEQTVAEFERLYGIAVERYQQCAALQGAVQAYMATIGSARSSQAGGAGASSTGAAPKRSNVQPRPSKPDGQRLTREQAVKLAEELPPPVVSNTGAKTHGLWVDEHGTAHKIVSGKDADADLAWSILRNRGIPVPAEPTTTSDVEQKLAARMVREGRKHLDVTLNNRPCRGVFGCDVLVPVILPEGYSLTVHAPNYKKTFTGGAQPW
jgi:SCP1.201-like deaminase